MIQRPYTTRHTCIPSQNILPSQGLVLLIQKSAPLEKFVRPEYGVIYVAQEYPRWQQLTLTILRGLYNEVSVSDDCESRGCAGGKVFT